VKQKRPVNLDLTSLKFPPMAIASILHRISGIVLFLLFPAMLYLLDLSLRSEESFIKVKAMIATPYWQLLLWLFSAAMAYHLLAGIRHIIMDLGFAEGLPTGRRTALFVFLLAIIMIIFLGLWIW
jgi:succinate dehydrogenase / fumarate reductase cytochrome b subunit